MDDGEALPVFGGGMMFDTSSYCVQTYCVQTGVTAIDVVPGRDAAQSSHHPFQTGVEREES